MRVLQLVQKPQRRGAEVFACQLNQWLRARGHEARAVFLYAYDGNATLPKGEGDVFLDAVERHGYEWVPGVQPHLVRRLHDVVRAFAPDVIQLNGARSVKYGAAMRAIDHGSSWKLVYRNIASPVFWVRGRVKRAFYRRVIMPRIDGVIGVSRQTLAEASDFYKLSVPQVFIPNGVDFAPLARARSPAEVRRELSTPNDAVVFLFVGSLSQYKQPDRFIRLFSQASLEVGGLHAWLLGDGPDRPELERQVKHFGLADRVRFLGYQEHVADFINAADVHASTSDTEGIPAAVLETGFLRKPTVAFRVGGMHECVRDGATGFLVAPGDECGFLSRMTELARSSELRQCLGQQAHVWIRDHFSIDRVGEQYESFYVRLGASDGAGRRR
ncbi:MAG: glycosyltransferase family 4 protein [Gemmatimonadales bacterium]